jgi:putative restriction endonuclease
MRERIARIRARIGYDELTGTDEIGCIQLVQPTFFSVDDWVPQPADWRPRTQSSARYDLEVGEGRRVWEACVRTASANTVKAGGPEGRLSIERQQRYGEPRLVQPRLGQATFRIAVLEAYRRGCAVTEEHSLPALEASHIRPYSQEGPHEVRNGLLLRADLHRLFDTGYATVTPDLRLEISSRLRRDYHNGRSYYLLHGAPVQAPVSAVDRPERAFLEWHNQQVFRA